MIQPPSVGPRVGPMKTPTPNRAAAVPRCSSENVSKRIAWEVDRRAPPPIPWMNRKPDELPDVVGLAAGGGGRREEEDRPDVVVPAPEPGGEEARHRDDDDVGDRVGGDDPGDVLERRPEVPAHVGEGDVHDRGVDQLDDRGRDDRDRDDHLPEAEFSHGGRTLLLRSRPRRRRSGRP